MAVRAGPGSAREGRRDRLHHPPHPRGDGDRQRSHRAPRRPRRRPRARRRLHRRRGGRAHRRPVAGDDLPRQARCSRRVRGAGAGGAGAQRPRLRQRLVLGLPRADHRLGRCRGQRPAPGPPGYRRRRFDRGPCARRRARDLDPLAPVGGGRRRGVPPRGPHRRSDVRQDVDPRERRRRSPARRDAGRGRPPQPRVRADPRGRGRPRGQDAPLRSPGLLPLGRQSAEGAARPRTTGQPQGAAGRGPHAGCGRRCPRGHLRVPARTRGVGRRRRRAVDGCRRARGPVRPGRGVLARSRADHSDR
ncbi:hypothetical protein SRABI128_00294 [Microbacterium sp. Bi128]|nr:hypothetical protein SRABI128_00294 [Microbacterium sp. Bi128]